jgi:hypothetical protein
LTSSHMQMGSNTIGRSSGSTYCYIAKTHYALG